MKRFRYNFFRTFLLIILESFNTTFVTAVTFPRFEQKMVPATLKEAFTKHRIVPDIIDKAPNNSLEIMFFYGLVPGFGKKLPCRDITEAPHLLRWPADESIDNPEHYSVVLVGLDEPSPKKPSDREYLHWMLTNIPGGAMVRRETHVEYLPPRPPKGTGPHRYAFLLFAHATYISFKEDKILTELYNETRRCKFSTRNFARKYNLGNPFAGNFFYTEWDGEYHDTVFPRRYIRVPTDPPDRRTLNPFIDPHLIPIGPDYFDA